MSRTVDRYHIQNVAVILAGSRTGSSFLFRSLTQSADVLAPTGEETPFYRLAGLGNFDSPDYDDSLNRPIPTATLDRAAEFLLSDTGVAVGQPIEAGLACAAFFRRLAIQWPDVIGDDFVRTHRAALVAKIERARSDWQPLDQTYRDWIQELRDQHGVPVDPQLFLTNGEHPVKPPLLEEPPYISPTNRLMMTPDSVATMPLLLKTSTNAYRVQFLRALFPRARFRWIVLRRNPAATINALIEGWLSSAFHAHNVHPHARLNIRGYSEHVPGGDRYWKFDMPPGWRDFKSATLAKVCAFQWHSAYAHIEHFLKTTTDPVWHVAYEDLLDQKAQGREVRNIIRFLEATPKAVTPKALPNEAVASVTRPAAGKWKARAPEVTAAMRTFPHDALLQLAERLEYPSAHLDRWP